MRKIRGGFTALAVAVSALLVASCGPGNNSAPVTLTAPASVATAPAGPGLAFTQVSTTGSVPAAAAVTLPTLTGAGAGTSATVGLAAQTAGGTAATASVAMSATAPTGPPTLASSLRETAGLRGAQNELSPISGILFFGISISAPPPPTAFTFAAAPSFSILLPAAYFAIPNASFYLAVYDPTKPTLGWQSRAETCTATVTSATLSCAAPAPQQPVTFLNNVTYYVALYAVSATTASPTPEPSVNPTAVPTNTAAPNTASASGTVTLASGATVTIPTLNSGGGTITLGTVSATTTAAMTTYLVVPPGLPNPNTTFAAAFYVVLTPAATVTISGTSSARFFPPTSFNQNQNSNTCPFIDMYDSSKPTVGWFLKALGPGSCNGGSTGQNSVTFSTTQSMTLTGGVTYAFGVYPST